ncbi:hypothetical protein HYDPIDRAFT_24299 [Hydnomerulius pinastri MD-312]|nr:hypothetical protein HYDPIDRAFT_24299 [Hydnomerulius pinastri MD-312]
MQPHIPQPVPCPLAPHSASPSQHNYGTRIRNNSVLKPSARLRQSPPLPHPAPRRIKPVPIPAGLRQQPPQEDPYLPVFPLPTVMLHPEDASSKVFQAIGRSFLSVDNRAMTIKDLAEMTLKYGLMCQNVSAASQAITTYIRNHLSRCEAQQDHPLLLRHVLSGTPADDDLVAALHSRIGGATNTNKPKVTGATEKKLAQVLQGAPEGERLTNFRRGTMVWYLSKATGVSCPFARAGIRLCEYGKEGKRAPGEYADDLQTVPRKKNTKREQAQCGEKRKRLRRGCRQGSEGSQGRSSVDRGSPSPAIDSGYGELSTDSSDSDSESDSERPPKVKLTLRLKPSAASSPAATRPREVIDLSNDMTSSSSEEDDGDDDDGDDVEMHHLASPDAPWSLPPYPRRSIAVPCYTPTCDDHPHPFTNPVQSHAFNDERRRSPSVPCSASPPPDSDHDDFDVDADSDFDWDSSSLSVSSPAVDVKVQGTDEQYPVKQEPRDVRDMLDAWEDLDGANPSTVSSATVKLPSTDDIKFEELEIWEWEFETGWAGASHAHEDTRDVKIEVDEPESIGSLYSPGAGFPVSPYSPFTPSASPSYSLSSPTSEAGVGSFTFHFPSPLSPSALSTLACPPFARPSSSPVEVTRKDSALTWQDAELLGPDSVLPQEFEDGWVGRGRTQTEPPSGSPRTSETPSSLARNPMEDRTPSVLEKDQEMRAATVDMEARPVSPPSNLTTPDIVVVHTCQPCVPAVSATQIEGISVYQTMLGSIPLLRRIDTDFVNLSTILSHLSLPAPSPLSHACITVAHPSPFINGTWAPLSVARLYAKGLPEGIEDVFLSDELVMLFPTALQDFHKKSTPGRMLNQFGPHFSASSSPSGSVSSLSSPKPDVGRVDKETVWEAPVDVGLAEEPLLAIPPSFNLALAALHPFTPTEDVTRSPETPLSPTEQEMFHTLCVHPDWEAEKGSEMVDIEGAGETETLAAASIPRDEKPLRRSKRVAHATAARTRAVPPRTRGPRHP